MFYQQSGWISAGCFVLTGGGDFIIDAFISPGLSGIFICPTSSAPDLLNDIHEG